MPATEGVVRPLYTDVAVLEAQETRKEIPCTVNPVKPELGFDLKFHSGYDVIIPLKALEGEGNQLTMIFRVVPSALPDAPVYLSQSVPVPPIEEDAKGDAYLDGSFDVGEGKYHVSWLMRDRSERICSSNWDIEAALQPRDKPLVTMKIAPGAVEAADQELFRPEPVPPREDQEPPLRLKVLVNFAPQNSTYAAIDPTDKQGLVAILRDIARDPRIGGFDLVAFSLQEERIVFRQEDARQLNFPALGDALQSQVFGAVRLRQLVEKHSGTEFIGDLFTREIGDTRNQFDGVVIVGPKVMNNDSVPADTLKPLTDLQAPVFYLNYIPNPGANPWRDAIGGAVRFLKGAEYTIARPRDFFAAWGEIIGRIMKSKGDSRPSQGPAAP
jgi:hypothetical protein